MVRRLLDPDRATGQRRFTDRAFRYTGYQSADLAYAVTGHSAQGATVHTGIALVTGSEDRQWLYPAMTRGTDANLAFVFTTPARPPTRSPAPGPPPNWTATTASAANATDTRPARPPPRAPGGADPREPIAVLADVLGRDGAELSASEIRQRNLANADHLAILHAIWTAETRGARDDRYRDLVHGRAAARLPAAALAPGPVAVPHPARRRTGRPGPRRGHPHRHRRPGPGRSPGHRRRPGRPDPPARPPAAPPAARPLGQTASPACPTPTARPTWPRSPP